MIAYSLPPLRPEAYAQYALKILVEVERIIPQALPMILRSDIVLTLSGVRAQTAYVDLPSLDERHRQQLVDILAGQGLDLFEAKSDVIDLNEPENWLLNNREALDDLQRRYKIDVFPTTQGPIDTFDKHVVWSMYVEATLMNIITKAERLSPTLMQDMWTAHNMRFGMLLGYPGPAIVSYCSLAPEDAVIESKIAYYDMYDAALPVYSYGNDVAGQSAVASHQRLWSSILTAVYESDWHKNYASSVEPTPIS